MYILICLRKVDTYARHKKNLAKSWNIKDIKIKIKTVM